MNQASRALEARIEKEALAISGLHESSQMPANGEESDRWTEFVVNCAGVAANVLVEASVLAA